MVISGRPLPGEYAPYAADDVGRIFAYRALCVARDDRAPLPGFDKNAYVAGHELHHLRVIRERYVR